MEIKDVLNNLDGMMVSDDLENDVILSFEDYEVNGDNEVIISKDNTNENIDYQAYINAEDSEIICIKVEGEKIRAWV